MIPKIIHYCWFGGNPLPKSAKACIASWEKFFPDYEIWEWNESNFDVNCCDYTAEAYKAGKYAFVSDYARFKILYDEGGLYFDTDVEVIRPIDDILQRGAFMGVERWTSGSGSSSVPAVAPGLGIAAAPGMELYKELIEIYHASHFVNADGGLNLKTVVDYTSECLAAHGMKAADGIQEVAGINIYPQDYFNPMNMDTGKVELTEDTRSIHHYAASWVDSYSIFRGKVYRVIYKVFGENAAKNIRKIVGRKK